MSSETIQPNVPSNPTPDAETLARLNSLAEEIDIDSIVIGDRIRRDFSHVPALAESIRENGLIQPIVITYDKKLIAGESRIRAHRALGLKKIRAVYRGVLDDAHLDILEVTENNERKELTWQERCLSVDRVHRYKTTEAVLRGQKWGMRESALLLKQSKSNIGLIIPVAEALHENNEEVWKAESVADAWRVLLGQREKEALKLVVAGAAKPTTPPSGKPSSPIQVPTGVVPSLSDDDFFTKPVEFFQPGVGGGLEVTDETPGVTNTPRQPLTIPLSRMLLKQDDHRSLSVMQALGPASVDHIICDPPYGIDMGNFQQDQGGQDVSGVAKEHDVEENLVLLDQFVLESFNILKDRGFLVMWCDPTMWLNLCNTCTSVGFRVQRWPLVWVKTSSCSNQSASTNFTKNIEFAVVARKGNATLISQQPSCVYTGGNDMETRLLGHPFAKPEGLWNWLYKAITQRGQTVLDPFVGVGSSTIPAIKFGLNPIGIECNETHYGRLLVNIQQVYRTIDKDVIFT